MADPTPGNLVVLPTTRGDVKALWHPAPAATAAVLMVGGFDGGFDGPAEGIYGTLADDLTERDIAALRVDFRIHRSPGPVDEGVFDVLTGIAFLLEQGITRVALVGHSFGAAPVITAGADHPNVVAVATMAAQTFGTRPVGRLSPRPLLLIHGSADTRLPPSCSEYLYARAGEPKELVIYEGATHSLRQRRAELRDLLVNWLTRVLR
jgi:fermentation-respiration switch protein FrsA (DUF1100 family)